MRSKVFRARPRVRSGWYFMMVLGVVVASSPAQAQSRDVVEGLGEEARPWTEGARPWAEGVPEADQERARAIFAEANQAMKDGLFARAAAGYRDTLARWDHPGAHYNLGLAQLSLDQPIDAYESFGKALRYGPSPLLGQEKYDQARRYLEMLEKQLARIELVCDEDGAEVTLNGEHVLTGPGRYEGMVRPGGHQIVASKPGRIPATEQAVLSPGDHGRYELVLAVPESVKTERLWAAWKPWAVVGAGALLMVGAGYFDQRSSQSFDSFDVAFDDLCRSGCRDNEVPSSLHETRERAERDQWVARAMYGVGGAALVTGVALVYVNRERLVRTGGTSGRERQARGRPAAAEPAPRLVVRPAIGPDRAGIEAELRF